MTTSTTIAERLAAIEALRPEAIELTRLIQSGHDLTALAPRIVDIAQRLEDVENAFREAVVAYVAATSVNGQVDVLGGGHRLSSVVAIESPRG